MTEPNESSNTKSSESKVQGVTISRKPGDPMRISELVADDLRAQILGDQIPEGARLPSEGELITTLGVSRATVREALRLLDADGLIVVKRGPQGGVTVRHPDPSHISRALATVVALNDSKLRELFDFRMAIEPSAAAAAAARDLTKEQIEHLRAAAIEPHAPVADRVDFHVLVSELSGNTLSYVFIAALQNVLQWHVELEHLNSDDVAGTGKAHERIATAIIDGDADLAERSMRKHLSVFRDRMEEVGRLDEAIIPSSHWQRRPSRR